MLTFFSVRNLSFPNCLCPLYFLIKALFAIYVPVMRATRPAYVILLHNYNIPSRVKLITQDTLKF